MNMLCAVVCFFCETYISPIQVFYILAPVNVAVDCWYKLGRNYGSFCLLLKLYIVFYLFV